MPLMPSVAFETSHTIGARIWSGSIITRRPAAVASRFSSDVAKPGVSLHDAIENIDIGGPSMLRSAAKNHESVTVVTDPADYAEIGAQIQSAGNTTLELRRRLAAKVYARTAAYDAAIAAHLGAEFGWQTVDQCMQIFGGNGYISGEYMIERIWRDLRVARVYDGSSEVQQMIIAGQLRKGDVQTEWQ